MPGLGSKASEPVSAITSPWESSSLSLPQFLHLYDGKSSSPGLLGLFAGVTPSLSCRGLAAACPR